MIEISRCGCGKIKLRHAWKKVALETVLQGPIPEIGKKRIITLKDKKGESVKLKNCLCPTCERASSGYFEGILQLRNKDNHSFDEIVDYVDKIILSKDDIFMSKIIELKDGLDLYLSSSRFMRQVSKDIQSRYGGELKTSKKLFSRHRQTGKELYRVTILIRLPNFTKGDVIKLNDKILSVKSITGSRITGTDLENCRKVNMPYREPEKIFTEIFNVQVVQKKPYLAVLDPITFQKTRIENPECVKSSDIKVIKIGERLLAFE